MQNFFVKNKSIVTFLILEVVALTAFNFGNVGHIFGIAGAVLAIFAAPFVIFTTEDKKSLIPVLIPIGLLLVISCWGGLNEFSKGFSTLSNLSLIVSLPAFVALGFFLRKLNDVKTKTVLLVVGGALALLTLFGLLSTVIEYGFFYRLIYKNTPNYYYDGIPYNVTKEMYWLTGFSFGEIYVEHGCLYAVLTASFLPGLLWLSPKKDKNEFIICAVIGGIGLLTLLILPNFKAIIILLVVSTFAFIYRFLKNNKIVTKILGICFIGFLGLAALFFIISLINASVGYKFTGLLNKVFAQNRIMSNVTPVYDALFMKVGSKLVNFFGLEPSMINEFITWLETNMFEIQLIKEIGLIGTLLFGLLLVVMGYFMYRYLSKGEDLDHYKGILVVMILSFFIYETFFYLVSIAPHEDSYSSFLRSPTLLVILFLFGYILTSPLRKEEKQHE